MINSLSRAMLLQVVLLSGVPSTASNLVTRLFECASSARSRIGAASAVFLRAAEVPDTSLARTLANLDTDGDGAVSPEEIKKFALLQGLDAGAVVEEFSGLDSNDDGILDKKELAAVLESAPVEKEERAGIERNAKAPPAVEVMPANSQSDSQEPVLIKGTMTKAGPHSVTQTKAHEDVHLSAADMTAKRVQAAAQLIKLVHEEEEQMKGAEVSERLAAEIRANLTAMAKAVEKEAFAASSKAASQRSKEILSEVTSLLSNAKKFEVHAAQLRAFSKAEIQDADTFMKVASSPTSRVELEKQ